MSNIYQQPVQLEAGNFSSGAEDAAVTITYAATGESAFSAPNGVQPLPQGYSATGVTKRAITGLLASSVAQSDAPATVPVVQIKEGTTVVFESPLIQKTAVAPFIYQLELNFPAPVFVAANEDLVVTIPALTNCAHTLCVTPTLLAGNR